MVGHGVVFGGGDCDWARHGVIGEIQHVLWWFRRERFMPRGEFDDDKLLILKKNFRGRT